MQSIQQELSQIVDEMAPSLNGGTTAPALTARYWRNRLRMLLKRGQLSHGQRQTVELLTRQLDGFEALARCAIHADLALIPLGRR